MITLIVFIKIIKERGIRPEFGPQVHCTSQVATQYHPVCFLHGESWQNKTLLSGFVTNKVQNSYNTNITQHQMEDTICQGSIGVISYNG